MVADAEKMFRSTRIVALVMMIDTSWIIVAPPLDARLMVLPEI